MYPYLTVLTKFNSPTFYNTVSTAKLPNFKNHQYFQIIIHDSVLSVGNGRHINMYLNVLLIVTGGETNSTNLLGDISNMSLTQLEDLGVGLNAGIAWEEALHSALMPITPQASMGSLADSESPILYTFILYIPTCVIKDCNHERGLTNP